VSSFGVCSVNICVTVLYVSPFSELKIWTALHPASSGMAVPYFMSAGQAVTEKRKNPRIKKRPVNGV
jgi:hypothetical protein